MSRLERFLRDYVTALHEGDAALFLGAGFSTQGGYVDWKKLLTDCASELDLDIDREHDLVAVAQYYLNHHGGERGRLNRILKAQFGRPGTLTENHRLMATLPVSTVWTTNYDSLIERAFSEGHRNVDVKLRDSEIPVPLPGRDVVLYKMHGDVSNLDQAVICKEDYERYGSTHHIFQAALETDLINKTFLFLGFSFSDPNLDYMLGHVRSILGKNTREHYAVIREVRLRHDAPNGEAERERWMYEQTRQAHKIRDLERYNIQTILVEHYSDVTGVLRALERGYTRRWVFVSGSSHDAGDFRDDRLRDLCNSLGERLIGEDYKLISGLGLTCGSEVVKGAIVKLYSLNRTNYERYLSLRPFPRDLPSHMEVDFNRKYRYDTIVRSGCAIFVAGRSRTHAESAGVMEEFFIARDLGKICIPIGATGFAARRIWQELEEARVSHYRGMVSQELYQKLNDPGQTNEELLNAVFEILDLVSRAEGVAIATGKQQKEMPQPRKSEVSS